MVTEALHTASPRFSRRAMVLAGGAAILLLAIFGLLVYVGLLFRSEGPLGNTAGNEAGANVRAGSTISLVYQLPDEQLTSPIELTDIQLVGLPRGFQEGDAGVVPCRPATEDCIPGAVDQWPPPTGEPHALDGYVLTKGGNPHIAIEVQVPNRGTVFRVRGVILTYTQGIRRFRTELGPVIRLHLKRP